VSQACASAGADAVTETGSVRHDDGGSSDTLSSAQFNSALKTLTRISIAMTGNANAVYSVATNSTSPFTTTGNSGTTLTLSDGIHHGIDADAERRRHRRFGQCQLIAFDVRGNLFSGIRVGL